MKRAPAGLCRASLAAVLAALLTTACGGAPPKPPAPKPAAAAVDPWGPRPAVADIQKVTPPRPVRAVITAHEAADADHPGLELLLVERHDSPAIFFKWVIPGGRRVEFEGGTPTRWPEGTVDLTAALLTEGTKKHRGASFAAALEGAGAQLTVRVASDALLVTGRVLSHQLGAFLPLLREALLEPELNGRALESLRKRERARLSNLGSRGREVGSRVFNRMIYGAAHPYGSPGLTMASVSAVRRDHVLRAREALVRLGGSSLVVVGDAKAAPLAAQLKATFGSALAGSRWRPGPLPAPAVAAPGCVVVDMPGAVQSVLVHGNPGPVRTSPRWAALTVANQVLGGSASSRLFTELRERKSLTYGVYSAFDGRQLAGDWSVSTSVRTAKTPEALDALRAELRKLQAAPPTAAELAAAQRYLVGQFVMGQASAQTVAARIARLRVYGLPDATWDRWIDDVRSTTATSVTSNAQGWMGTADSLTLVVGDLKALRPALDARCKRLVRRDVAGAVIGHLIDDDDAMSDAERKALFALWGAQKNARSPLDRYVRNTARAAAHRAQAMHALLTGVHDAACPALGEAAGDWRAIADALVPLLTAELTDATPKRARAARRWLLDLASPTAGSSPLTSASRDRALRALSEWAFAGVRPDGETAAVRALVAPRITVADLSRLGAAGVPGLEALVSANVWRTPAAEALVAQGSGAASSGLAHAYRRALVVHRALPSERDLALLAQAPSARVALLLFDVYTIHRLGPTTPERASVAVAVMVRLRAMIDAMAAQTSRENRDDAGERTVLARDFRLLMGHFESLLSSPDPDDRWWAADHLLQYRADRGLRLVLQGLADDGAYGNAAVADEPVAEALDRIARSRVARLDAAGVRSMLLAALAGRSRVAKALAVWSLRAATDESSMTVLRTHHDDTDLAQTLGVAGPLTVTALARAAVTVRRYSADITAKEKAGKLSARAATRLREAAFATFQLQGRALAEHVAKSVPAAPRSAPPKSTGPTAGAPANK